MSNSGRDGGREMRGREGERERGREGGEKGGSLIAPQCDIKHWVIRPPILKRGRVGHETHFHSRLQRCLLLKVFSDANSRTCPWRHTTQLGTLIPS